MKKYKHLFFDLDRTLWDFELNSSTTIIRLFEQYQLQGKLNVDCHQFLKKYKAKNEALWADYRIGKIAKNELRMQRYHRTFLDFDLDDKVLAMQFNDDYVTECSSRTELMSGALEVLDYLAPKYELHIITNGFGEAQYKKLTNSGIAKYFNQVVVSDGLGFNKPDKRIFYYALKQAKASIIDSVMIGDDYGPDILGARSIGMDQVYFCENKENKEATFIIQSLNELMKIL